MFKLNIIIFIEPQVHCTIHRYFGQSPETVLGCVEYVQAPVLCLVVAEYLVHLSS